LSRAWGVGSSSGAAIELLSAIKTLQNNANCTRSQL
jgi:hypothetical protein